MTNLIKAGEWNNENDEQTHFVADVCSIEQ